MASAEVNKNGISISLKRRRILVYKETLRSIGAPQNIRFLLNTKKKRIAVQACEAIDRDSFTVPDISLMGDTQFEITSITFARMLYNLSGWNEDLTYRIMGTVHPKNRLVEYDLGNAMIIADEEFVDPENTGL